MVYMMHASCRHCDGLLTFAPAARPALASLHSVDAPAVLLALGPVALVALPAAEQVHTVPARGMGREVVKGVMEARNMEACTVGSAINIQAGDSMLWYHLHAP
jgi:hypothetical protein